MTTPFIQYSLVVGEISPKVIGNSDLDRHSLGLQQCRNFIVDYRGGVSYRPGTSFVDFVKEDDKNVRFIRFKFSLNNSDSYLLVFGHNYVRFVNSGAYVLETAVNISSITQANPGVVTTSASHGYANGDWVQINSVVGMTELNTRTFEITNVTATTFELLDPFGNNFDTSAATAYTSGGTVERIHTVTTTYGSDDLADLRVYQDRNKLVITSPDHQPAELERVANDNWTLTDISFGTTAATPNNGALNPSAAGSAGTSFAVTSVNLNGEESLPFRS
jgi:hypothetical protein